MLYNLTRITSVEVDHGCLLSNLLNEKLGSFIDISFLGTITITNSTVCSVDFTIKMQRIDNYNDDTAKTRHS